MYVSLWWHLGLGRDIMPTFLASPSYSNDVSPLWTVLTHELNIQTSTNIQDVKGLFSMIGLLIYSSLPPSHFSILILNFPLISYSSIIFYGFLSFSAACIIIICVPSLRPKLPFNK